MYINNGIFSRRISTHHDFSKDLTSVERSIKTYTRVVWKKPSRKDAYIYIYINMIELTIEEYGYSWRIKEWDYILRKSSG